MRALAAGLFAALYGCTNSDGYQPTIEGGDPKRGRVAVAELECGACHIIPGVPGAVGRVGPPLNEYARNVYIAGNYPNVPSILIQFVRDAPSLAPQTAMPAIEMSEAQSRDIAAFLYSLQ
jgi:mono/diheme cytochrome c family protein